MKKLTILILFILSGAIYSFGQNFEIAPTRLDYDLEPGQSGMMQINIVNHASTPQDYTISLSDFIVDSLNNIMYTNAGTTERSVTDWVNISPTFFSLQPNESTKIDVTLSVPSGDEGIATKWGMLFIQEVTEQNAMSMADKSTKAGITINPSIGVYVIQSPASYSNESATISNFQEVEKNKKLSVDIKNLGDKILTPKVYLIVSNLETADETTLEAVEVSLLPGVKKTVALPLPENILPGNYSITAVLDYSPNKDLEGVIMDYTVN